MEDYLQLLAEVGQSGTISFTLVYVASLVRSWLDKAHPRVQALATGLLFGLAGITGLLVPIHILPGTSFGGASVTIAFAGIVGGPLAALFAGLLAGVAHVMFSSTGALVGLGRIVTGCVVGMVWHTRFGDASDQLTVRRLNVLSLIMVVTGVGWALLLPVESGQARLLQLVGYTTSLNILSVYLLGLLIDREARLRRDKEALKESDWRYRAIFDHSPIAIGITISPGTILATNQAFSRILGYTGEEFLGDPNLSFYKSPDVRERLAHEFALKGEVHDYEIEIRRKDGTFSDLLVDMISMKLDGKDVVLTLARDISLRKQAERHLRESEVKWRTLAETSPDTMMTIDRDRKLLYINRPVAGASPGDRIGKDFFGFVTPAYQAMAETHVDGVFRSGETAEFEIQVSQAGTARWLMVRVAAVRHDGEVTAATIISTDITERKQAEEVLRKYRESLENQVAERTRELVAANDELKELGHVKDKFVANVSHELRSPLASFKLHLKLLTMRPDKRESYMATLAREAQRLENLVESLLYVARLDQGRIKFSYGSISLNELISDYISDRKPIAEERDLVLTAMLWPDLPAVQADKDQLGQVMSILLTNAVNYTPPGGQVSVITQVTHNENKDWVVFSVEDSGPGISLEEQQALFTRFFRGSAGRESSTPGTGLGLAIAKEIIDQHHGKIEVKSSGIPGEGTTFSVWLEASKN